MDYEKQIRILSSENEFLQLQLEELNNEVKAKSDEVELLHSYNESTAFLRSKIDGNTNEIAQLKHNLKLQEQKALGIEILNEELEINLMRQVKRSHIDEAGLKEMNSVKANMEIVSEELNEAAAMYKKNQALKKELAAAKSIAEMHEMENINLRAEVEEMRQLINLLKHKKNA